MSHQVDVEDPAVKPRREASQQERMAISEWRSRLAAVTGVFLLYETVTGLLIYLAPFSQYVQFSVVVHTIVGLALLPPIAWYVARHWWVRRRGNLSHFQLLGYIAWAILAICIVSGLIVTYQGLVGPRMEYVWDVLHLISGIGATLFVIAHLATVIVKKVNHPEARGRLVSARRLFYVRGLIGLIVLLGLCAGWTVVYDEPGSQQAFPGDYNWRFGDDRPFAPSLARVDQDRWMADLREAVEQASDPKYHSQLATAFDQPPTEGNGVFANIKQCAASTGMEPGRLRAIDNVLVRAAEQKKATGAIPATALAGSKGCGSGGCHEQIYREWLPSAHRYSSLDDMFQRVQKLMAKETSPEHTRYCAGCHDPISLFSGAKNSGNVTLSSLGSDEGISCLTCHSIVQTDVQGNGDYTIRPAERYVYEQHKGPWAKRISDFLIRTYPNQHVHAYSRSLYKTPEFCGACHKQYLDKDVNTDIGKVQGQNQYDSWKNSRWYHEDDPNETLACRECHMPLTESNDPARGDATDYNRSVKDNKHRSHRTLAANQYIPALHQLEGYKEHVELTEKWLQGKVEIPEIADKWMSGPVVKMEIHAPAEVAPGQKLSLQVVLTNNKAGHDFPTGPLDMLESWIELTVTDSKGRELFHSGAMDAEGHLKEPKIWYKADGFDRRGGPIDRHNLWDLVGAKYKRTLYPGVTDSMEVQMQCPSMARGRIQPKDASASGSRAEQFSLPTPEDSEASRLEVEAVLWYRKANPQFIDRVYGEDSGIRSPITELTRQTHTITITGDKASATE